MNTADNKGAIIGWVGVIIAKGLLAIGVHNWADFSAMIVSAYTLLLFLRFIWRWVKGLKTEVTEDGSEID